MTNAAQFALTHGAAMLFMWILAQQAGAPIPSAPVLIAVGSLASSRRIGLTSSLIGTFSACLLANGFWYRLGRQGWSEGHWLCRANRKWQGRALRLMRAHSSATLLLAKFIAGSNFASLLAGKAGVSLPRFLTYESIGSLTWSGTYIAVGYLFHGHLHWTLVQTLGPLLAARVAAFLGRLWRGRSLAHAAILAVATLFFCALRPVSKCKAALRVATAFTSPQLTTKSSRRQEWLADDSHALIFGDKEMTEQIQIQAREKEANVYASREDFHTIFKEDLKQLYQLSFLLTRDAARAELCLVVGLEECVKGNSVFREWARSWAKRVIVQNAIREIKPRPVHSNSHVSDISFSDIAQLSSTSDQHFASEAVLNLEDFERFAFIISVLEHYSDHDCALLLGCSVREILEARARALGELMEPSQGIYSRNQPLVLEKK